MGPRTLAERIAATYTPPGTYEHNVDTWAPYERTALVALRPFLGEGPIDRLDCAASTSAGATGGET